MRFQHFTDAGADMIAGKVLRTGTLQEILVSHLASFVLRYFRATLSDRRALPAEEWRFTVEL